MADRTYGKVDARLYDEWRLSKRARAILAHIIALSPTQYGIHDPSPLGGVLDWWDGLEFTRENIRQAWDELISRGIIASFRNEECAWLVKQFKRELPYIRSEKHRQGVANFIENYPEIRDDFCKLYDIQISNTGIQINNNRIQMVSRCQKTVTPDSDSDTDSDIKDTLTSISSSAPPPDAGRQLRELADNLHPLVKTAWEDFAAMVADNRVSKRVRPAVLLKILRPVSESAFSPDAIAYGLEQATRAGAENHTYVLKAAASYGSRRETDFDRDVRRMRETTGPVVREHGDFEITETGEVYQDGRLVRTDPADVQRLGDAIRERNLLGGIRRDV